MKHTIESSLWRLIPFNLEWQIEQRNNSNFEDNSHIKQAINISVLINLSSMIEGYLQEILLCHLKSSILFYPNFHSTFSKKKSLEQKTLGSRILVSIIDEIEKSTWRGYPDLFMKIFGAKLNDLVSSETGKAIQIQFKIRNSIAHGNPIIIENIEKEPKQFSYRKNYHAIFKYAKEKKLIDIVEGKFITSAIFNDKLVNHFLVNSINLIEELLEKLDYDSLSVLKLRSKNPINTLKKLKTSS